MKKKRRILQSALIVFLLAMLLAPVSMAFAEQLGTTSVVATESGFMIGETYQRHSLEVAGRHWVFWNQGTGIYYASSVDGTTFEVSESPLVVYTCTLTEPIPCKDGSSFSLWLDDDDYVHMAYLATNGLNQSLYYARMLPQSTGTIPAIVGYEAVEPREDVYYRAPSISTNSSGYPYIAYYSINTSDSSNSEGFLTANTKNDGTWVSATNSSIDCGTIYSYVDGEMGEPSLLSYYPSVIPGVFGETYDMNVFYMMNTDIGDYTLFSNFIEYNIASDEWNVADKAAVFSMEDVTEEEGLDFRYHSEVYYDELTVAIAPIHESEDMYLALNWYDEIHAWNGSNYIDIQEQAEVLLYGSIGVRNSLSRMVITAAISDMTESLYSADWLQTTLSSMTLVHTADITVPTMSSYSFSGDTLGFLYQDGEDLTYGCYGCTEPTTPSTIPTSVTTMAWIVVLVFGALICILLIGYGAYETIKGRDNLDLVKIGVIGLITFIIAAIIVENLL